MRCSVITSVDQALALVAKTSDYETKFALSVRRAGGTMSFVAMKTLLDAGFIKGAGDYPVVAGARQRRNRQTIFDAGDFEANVKREDEIARLKAADRQRLDAKIAAIIARSPAIQRKIAEAQRERELQRLKKRADEALINVAALQTLVKKKSEFMYLPGGVHTLVPLDCRQVSEIVDEKTAIQIEAQRRLILAKGSLPYIDFNHNEEGPAAFYPHEFIWRDNPAPGVYVRGNFSAEGKKAVESGEYRFFSPQCTVETQSGAPYKIVCLLGVAPNMGGILRLPGAFGESLRLRITESSDPV